MDKTQNRLTKNGKRTSFFLKTATDGQDILLSVIFY